MPVMPIVFPGDSLTEQHGFVNKGVGGETSRLIRMRLAFALENTGAQGLHLLCRINDIAKNEDSVLDEAICGRLRRSNRIAAAEN